MTTPALQRLIIPITDDEWLLQNHRPHPQVRARKVRSLRAKAGWMARAELLPVVDPAAIFTRAYIRSGALCDDDAIAPMVKAIKDGLVDAGTLRDDAGEYVALTGYGRPERDRTLKQKHAILIVLTTTYIPF